MALASPLLAPSLPITTIFFLQKCTFEPFRVPTSEAFHNQIHPGRIEEVAPRSKSKINSYYHIISFAVFSIFSRKL